MRHGSVFGAIVVAAVAAASPAVATTINFDDLAVGSVLSNQYAALGVTFSPNAFTGADWATNTDMTIVSSTGTDVGALGTPSLVSGNLFHSFNGWLNEDGDPSFAINFSSAISSISLDFAGVQIPAATAMFIYNGATLLTTVRPSSQSTVPTQYTLSYSAPAITQVVVTAGSFEDWVGVDNLVFTPAATSDAPEPASWAMMIVGFGLTGGALRRRRNVTVRFAC